MSPDRSIVVASSFVSLCVASVSLAADPCGTWSNVPSPNPDSGNNGLAGVAVAHPEDVWALGGGSNGRFLLRWDGGSWNEMTLPPIENPGIGWDLDAIASVAPGQVWAAGAVATTQWTTVQLLVHWDGSDWTREKTLELEPQRVYPYGPRHGGPVDLDGTGPDDIWIVGSASGWGDGRSGTIPLVVHWDGSDLIEMELPLLSTERHHLYGVTVIAPDDVWAVGMHKNVQRQFVGMTYHWDGSTWEAVLSPAEGLPFSELDDVFAIASDDVWAIGTHNGDPFFMHWNGTRWRLVEDPDTGVTSMAKLAGTATDDVWAVSHFEPGYFHWDGATWSIVEPPDVPGAEFVNRGGGLAVAGDCDVWCVGGFTEGGWQHTLSERLLGAAGVPGDANGDGVVDFADLLLLLSSWGPCEGDCPADLDEDGTVGFADLLILLANWS